MADDPSSSLHQEASPVAASPFMSRDEADRIRAQEDREIEEMLARKRNTFQKLKPCSPHSEHAVEGIGSIRPLPPSETEAPDTGMPPPRLSAVENTETETDAMPEDEDSTLQKKRRRRGSSVEESEEETVVEGPETEGADESLKGFETAAVAGDDSSPLKSAVSLSISQKCERDIPLSSLSEDSVAESLSLSQPKAPEAKPAPPLLSAPAELEHSGGPAEGISSSAESFEESPSESSSLDDSQHHFHVDWRDSPHVLRLIRRSHNIVVLAGAGMSSSAGLPTFRGPNGVYDELRKKYEGVLRTPEETLDFRTLSTRPDIVYDTLMKLWPGKKYRPSAMHYFIRLLSEHGKLLRLYTQNIDGLDFRAGIPREKVVQLHGSFESAVYLDRTESESGQITLIPRDFPIDPVKEMLQKQKKIPVIDLSSDRKVLLAYDPEVRNPATMPQFAFVRPRVALYHDLLLPSMDQWDLQDKMVCDLLLIIGTGLTVAPANRIAVCTHVADGGELPRLCYPRVWINTSDPPPGICFHCRDRADSDDDDNDENDDDLSNEFLTSNHQRIDTETSSEVDANHHLTEKESEKPVESGREEEENDCDDDSDSLSVAECNWDCQLLSDCDSIAHCLAAHLKWSGGLHFAMYGLDGDLCSPLVETLTAISEQFERPLHMAIDEGVDHSHDVLSTFLHQMAFGSVFEALSNCLVGSPMDNLMNTLSQEELSHVVQTWNAISGRTPPLRVDNSEAESSKERKTESE